MSKCRIGANQMILCSEIRSLSVVRLVMCASICNLHVRKPYPSLKQPVHSHISTMAKLTWYQIVFICTFLITACFLLMMGVIKLTELIFGVGPVKADDEYSEDEVGETNPEVVRVTENPQEALSGGGKGGEGEGEGSGLRQRAIGSGVEREVTPAVEGQ